MFVPSDGLTAPPQDVYAFRRRVTPFADRTDHVGRLRFLLCSVTNLLNNPSSLVNLLNQILGAL